MESKLSQELQPTTQNKPAACTKCEKPIDGQFVRALGGCFHMNCFQCLDCGKVVAQRFFPLEDPATKKVHPLCERDYFKRLDLLCHNCNEALRGSYITALGNKYHLEHFTCSMCTTVFGPDETYYEHAGKILCHNHYSKLFAVKCGGCKMAILKQFVEVKAAQNEQWHPECYMIFKSWNLRMAPSQGSIEDKIEGAQELKLQQQLMEEKVNRIWSVLSAFEESAAACISDMLLHVSNQCYIDAVSEAGNFIMHVEVLFNGIDDLEAEIGKFNDTIGLSYNREPKMLSKKIVNFFSLLSHTQDTGVKQYGTVTQELLSLVTSLAQYLKILIRIALSGALKLERQYNVQTAIGDFLNKLIELGQEEVDASNTNLKFDQRYKLADIDVKSDLCLQCRTSVEDSCFRLNTLRWHKKCFQCHVCQKSLQTEWRTSSFDVLENKILCAQHSTIDSKKNIENVTQLQQYTFLLRVALKRLYGLLKVKDDFSAVSSSTIAMNRIEELSSSMPINQSIVSMAELPPAEQESTAELKRTIMETTQLGSQNNLAAEEPKIAGAKQKVEQSTTFGSVHNLIEEMQTGIQIPGRRENSTTSTKNLSTSLPDLSSTSGPVGRSKLDDASKWPIVTQPSDVSAKIIPSRDASGRKAIYLSELSALESFIVRHVAVLKMQPMIQEFYSVTDLLDVIRGRKANFWTKILSSFKPGKKQQKPKEGSFGVNLEMVIEKNGVDSKFGTGFGRLRIPIIMEQAFAALKGMDCGVEGIFRKNGNIKNLSILQDKLDKDPWLNLKSENPIQLAALIKKFFRDMPEPLLTFKLYKLFIISQKLSNLEHRKKILQYTVSLLPKPNRDLLEVLLVFLREIAQKSSTNKMDLSNLATVITPNILYAKSKSEKQTVMNALAKDESFLAIDAVKMLLQFQDEMWAVPNDIADVLSSHELNLDTELSPKEVIKRYEMLFSVKKSEFFDNASLSTNPGVASIENSQSGLDDQPVLGGQMTSAAGKKK